MQAVRARQQGVGIGGLNGNAIALRLRARAVDLAELRAIENIGQRRPIQSVRRRAAIAEAEEAISAALDFRGVAVHMAPLEGADIGVGVYGP